MSKTERNKMKRHPYAYSPTRFEYFAAAAMQGLVSGRSIKDAPKVVSLACQIARDMEDQCDIEKTDRPD